jgi:hypothetical protein
MQPKVLAEIMALVGVKAQVRQKIAKMGVLGKENLDSEAVRVRERAVVGIAEAYSSQSLAHRHV